MSSERLDAASSGDEEANGDPAFSQASKAAHAAVHKGCATDDFVLLPCSQSWHSLGMIEKQQVPMCTRCTHVLLMPRKTCFAGGARVCRLQNKCFTPHTIFTTCHRHWRPAMDPGAVLCRLSYLDNDTMPFEHGTVCPGQGIMVTRPTCCSDHSALVLVRNCDAGISSYAVLCMAPQIS